MGIFTFEGRIGIRVIIKHREHVLRRRIRSLDRLSLAFLSGVNAALRSKGKRCALVADLTKLGQIAGLGRRPRSGVTTSDCPTLREIASFSTPSEIRRETLSFDVDTTGSLVRLYPLRPLKCDDIAMHGMKLKDAYCLVYLSNRGRCGNSITANPLPLTQLENILVAVN